MTATSTTTDCRSTRREQATGGTTTKAGKTPAIAIVNRDGTNAKLPIATCELQGYVVAAKRAWADVVEQAFDDLPPPPRLRDEADRLAEIDRPAILVGSRGYLLSRSRRRQATDRVSRVQPWTPPLGGRGPADRAAPSPSRLLEADMWSGWGIRTLSTPTRRIQPALLSARIRLAARQRHHRQRAAPATATVSRQRRSHAACSTPHSASNTRGCRKCSPASPATKDRSPSNTWEPTSPKPGRRARSSTSSHAHRHPAGCTEQTALPVPAATGLARADRTRQPPGRYRHRRPPDRPQRRHHQRATRRSRNQGRPTGRALGVAGDLTGTSRGAHFAATTTPATRLVTRVRLGSDRWRTTPASTRASRSRWR